MQWDSPALSAPPRPPSPWGPALLGAVCGALAGLCVTSLHATPTAALFVPVAASTPAVVVLTPSRAALRRTARHAGDIKHMVDFGARDPYDGELATNFAEKNIGGAADTMHVVKIPETARAKVGLLAKRCAPLTDDVLAMTEDEANVARASAGPGVIILKATPTGQLRLRVEWTVAGPEAAAELTRLAQAVVDAEQWPVTLRTEGEMVVAETWTEARGGVTLNDFILAAKLNNMEVAHLLKKRKRRIFA
eukprot:EG_transcript_18628